MGWNSWNCFAGAVNQEKVLRGRGSDGEERSDQARLDVHQHRRHLARRTRTGKDHALQGNQKFPDMKKLCDEIHGLGLKAGIYSTPWITSYAGHAGGSADNPEGDWDEIQGTRNRSTRTS